MNDLDDPGARPGHGPLPVEVSAHEIDDILEDLPGGQSVSAATRRLLQSLHDARRRGAVVLPAPRPAQDDIIYAPPVPVRQAPGREPQRFLAVCTQDLVGSVGVGVVAEGCQFSDGSVVWRRLWMPGWEFYEAPGVDPFVRAHQHQCVLEVVHVDEP